MKPLVNIIVAVYCAENYIERCLESILSQDYENWRAIIVNDASTDNSLEIIKKYTGKDRRFTVINNEKNMGVAAARNRALGYIDGEYTAFLDSDDWWEPQMLSVLVEKAVELNADIVQCKYRYDYENGYSYEPADIFADGTVLEKQDMKRVYKLMMTGMRMNHVCMKLYDSGLLLGKTFDETMKTGEDLVFNIKIMPGVNRFVYLASPMYHYFRVANGLTGAGLSFWQKWENNRHISKIMKKELKNTNMNTLYYSVLVWLRPYKLVFSKIYRMFMDKLLMSRRMKRMGVCDGEENNVKK